MLPHSIIHTPIILTKEHKIPPAKLFHPSNSNRNSEYSKQSLRNEMVFGHLRRFFSADQRRQMIAVEGKSSRKAGADDSLCGWAGLIYCSNLIAKIILVRDPRSEVGSSTITWSMAGSVATTSKGLIRGQKDLVCISSPGSAFGLPIWIWELWFDNNYACAFST